MLYSTLQAIRERAGIQNYVIDGKLNATGDSSIFLTKNLDLDRFVPRQSNGATIASLSDINVKINGLSVGVSAIDISGGFVTLVNGTTSGASIVATYASSPLTSSQVYRFATEANSVIQSYVSKKYELGNISGACIPLLADLETKLASANILQSSYGVSGDDSGEDGYRMFTDVMDTLTKVGNGELNLIDIDGVVIPPNTSGVVGNGNASGTGARVKGYLFTTDQERFTVVNPDSLTQW